MATMQDERLLTPRMTSSGFPLTPRRAESSSPYSTGSSPNSRRPLWEGLDPARLAAREASIRARMESRRANTPSTMSGDISGRSVSSPFPRDGSSSRPELPRTPVMSSRQLDQNLDVSPLSTTYARPYSPFDVGLDRVRNTFNSSPGPRLLEAAFIRHSQSSPTASTPVREDKAINDFTPWTSYFDDPYRSPSAASSFREECAAPPRQQHLPESPLQLPRLPWAGEVRRPSMERRGSAPTSSPKASTLKDLEDISRSLSKKSKRLSGASLLVDARSQVWDSRIPSPLDRNYRDDRTPAADQIERNRQGTLASLSSGASPVPRIRSRDSIKSLHRMSNSSPSTPIGEAPQLPLPLLPGKKERRRVRVRASETNEGTWELDDVVDGLDRLKGLGTGAGLGCLPVDEAAEHQAGVDDDMTITLNTPNMSSLSETIVYTETLERVSSNQPNGILDPNAPASSVQLCIPTDRSLGDLAGMLIVREDHASISSHQTGKEKGQSAKMVLDFPLPPVRALKTCLDAPEDGVARGSAGHGRKLDAAFELHPEKLSSNVQGDPNTSEEFWAETQHTVPAALKSYRSSASSHTTAASSCTQLTPRNSLERIIQSPHVRQDSSELPLASLDLANLDCLTSGDLETMLSAVEIDSGLDESTAVRVRKPQPGTPMNSVASRRVLPPPGPDAAYWGEPEIILFDQDSSTAINSAHNNSLYQHGMRDSTKFTRHAGDSKNDTVASARSGPYVGSSIISQDNQKSSRTVSPFTPKAKQQSGLRLPTPRRVMPTRSVVDQSRSVSSSNQLPSGRNEGLVDRMAAFLPIGLGLTRLRANAAIRAGSSVLRNVGRVGTAVSAYNYAKPMLGRLTERSSKNYEGHIPLNWFENAFLAGGSGVIGVADTSRGDLVALLSETSSQSFMPRLHAAMKSQPEGRQILKDRPLISSKTVDLDYLRTLQRGTLGREWVEWLMEGGVTPDTRHEVVHIDSPVLAYTMTRYRQTHDLYHTLFSLPPTLAYELSLKVLELSNMSLPVAGLSSAFGPFRLSSARRQMWREDWMGWALRQGARSRPLVGIYWEKRWEQGLGDLRRELGVKRMDDRAVINRWKSYRMIREKESALRAKGEWVDEPEEW